MKPLQLHTVAMCFFLTACGGSSGTTSNNGLVTISEANPLVLDESDTVAVYDVSLDFYRSVDDSCSNPADSQYLGLSTTLAQKTLLCIEYSIGIESSRDFTLNLTLDYPDDANDTSADSDGSATDIGEGLRIDSYSTIFASSERLGLLPQNIVASLGIYDIEGNIVSITSTSLQLNGDLPSTADTPPEGTNISITYTDSDIFVSTVYRDLPTDTNFCVDHDRRVIDPLTGELSREHIVAIPLNVSTDGTFHTGFSSLGTDIPAGIYEARVYELSTDGGTCFVFDEEYAPVIEYTIKN